MKILPLALSLIALTGLSVPSARAEDSSTVALAKKVEAWLDKDRILRIQEATRMLSDLPGLTDGPCFDIGGERFNECELGIVAHAISWEGDWPSAQVWDALLESPLVHVRCIAAHCLLFIHRIPHHPGRLVVFNCFTDPQTDQGRKTREEFRKQLSAAKLQEEMDSKAAGQKKH